MRFDFTDEDVDTEKEQTLRLEARWCEVVIKRHGAPSITRPVVTQEFCLYNQIYRTEFSLADRGKFNYSILLGRSFLSRVALVDPAETFLSRPNCAGDTTVMEMLTRAFRLRTQPPGGGRPPQTAARPPPPSPAGWPRRPVQR